MPPFRRISRGLSTTLGSLARLATAREPRPSKPVVGVESFQRRPDVARRGPNLPDVGPTELEARAAQNVEGSLPERIVYKELERRRELFEFSSGLHGGGIPVANFHANFLILSRAPNIALDVQTDWNRPPLGPPAIVEITKAASIEANGYIYEQLWDDLDIYPSRERLEERMEEVLGRSIITLGSVYSIAIEEPAS